MTTVLSASLPRTGFALRETLSTVPEVAFEVEGIVEAGDEMVMPLVWATDADHDQLEEALRADPTTEDVELLSEIDTRRLYRMEWIDHIRLLLRIIVTNEATVVKAATSDDDWRLRVIYPTHDGVNDTEAYCEAHNVPLTIDSIEETEDIATGRYGLSTEQYEALTTAYDRGYFGVPRGTSLADLANEFDISHQAFSERIRRAEATLVEETLFMKSPSD